MFARCSSSILNCNDIYFARIVYQSSKAALSKKEIEREKKALGNARVSSRITGQIRRWIKFLKAENSAIQNSVIETTKRFESKCAELSLSVLNSWYEAPEGVFVEFSFRKSWEIKSYSKRPSTRPKCLPRQQHMDIEFCGN